MVNSINHSVELHNGVLMPIFGLGVYKVEEGVQITDTIKTAMKLGYRSIDTAKIYQNEEGVGKAIRESGIDREELFITTKVWNSDQGYNETLEAFNESMSKLGLGYIDLYLVHWPVQGKYNDTWRALETLYEQGKVRAIGVSNFQTHHLEDVLKIAKVKPMVNQVELHPRLSQKELRDFCVKHDIKVEAWSPIARGKLIHDPTLASIAKNHGKTSVQVILRWHLQNNIIVIPKSITPERLKENADIFNFELSIDEMRKIDELNLNERYGPNPDNFDF